MFLDCWWRCLTRLRDTWSFVAKRWIKLFRAESGSQGDLNPNESLSQFKNSIGFAYSRKHAEGLQSVEYEWSPDCRANGLQKSTCETRQRHRYNKNRQTHPSNTRWQVRTLGVTQLDSTNAIYYRSALGGNSWTIDENDMWLIKI